MPERQVNPEASPPLGGCQSAPMGVRDETGGVEMTAERGFDIARMWAVWHRRKWLAIVAFVLSVTLVISFLVFLPRIYRATATVLVERQSVPEEFVRPTVTTTLETRLQTISQDILSRQRLEALIKR